MFIGVNIDHEENTTIVKEGKVINVSVINTLLMLVICLSDKVMNFEILLELIIRVENSRLYLFSISFLLLFWEPELEFGITWYHILS